MSRERPVVRPELSVGEMWSAITAAIPSTVLDDSIWDELSPLASVVPGPVVGFERSIDDPRLTEWGFPLPRWQRTNALSNPDPHSNHVGTLARIWLTDTDLNRLCDLQMHTWDIGDEGINTPCVFLRVDSRVASGVGESAWKAMIRGYATALRAERSCVAGLSPKELADRMEDAVASTPLSDVSSVGIYLGRPGCPVRLTIRADVRPWADHPIWTTVDEVVQEAGWNSRNAIVAVPPGADPGNIWHVPLLVDRRTKPAAALLPLLRALITRNLATSELVDAMANFDVRAALPLHNATLDGVPALATLWASPERIKVVVQPGEWRSAKIDLLARVIWRDISGRVFINH
jgi:hypothetical protein